MRSAPSCSSKPASGARPGCGGRAHDGGREHAFIADRHGLARGRREFQKFPVRPDVGQHDAQAAGQGLEHGIRQALRTRGGHEEVGCTQVGRDVVDLACETDAGIAARLALALGLEGALAEEDEREPGIARRRAARARRGRGPCAPTAHRPRRRCVPSTAGRDVREARRAPPASRAGTSPCRRRSGSRLRRCLASAARPRASTSRRPRSAARGTP